MVANSKGLGIEHDDKLGNSQDIAGTSITGMLGQEP